MELAYCGRRIAVCFVPQFTRALPHCIRCDPLRTFADAGDARYMHMRIRLHPIIKIYCIDDCAIVLYCALRVSKVRRDGCGWWGAVGSEGLPHSELQCLGCRDVDSPFSSASPATVSPRKKPCRTPRERVLDDLHEEC